MNGKFADGEVDLERSSSRTSRDGDAEFGVHSLISREVDLPGRHRFGDQETIPSRIRN